MARSARCDVRCVAAVFVGSDETMCRRFSSVLDTFRRLLLQIGGANIGRGSRVQPAYFVVVRRGKNASARSSVHCSLRSLRLAPPSCCLPLSLSDEKRVRSLDRPGQQRVSLAQHAARDPAHMLRLLGPARVAK